MAMLFLVRLSRGSWAGMIAGLLAGLWSVTLDRVGLGMMLAVLVAASVPLASAALSSTRPVFAPPALREESLLFLLVFALIVAAAPAVTGGWEAAGNLKLQSSADAAAAGALAVPLWAVILSGAALVSGGAYAMWSRR
jgi:hypothetical protein